MFGEVLAAMGAIYAYKEACVWAWNTGANIGTAIGKWLFY